MAWNLGSHRRIVNITGTVNSAGSTATRIARDGSSALFTWDPGKGCYTSADVHWNQALAALLLAPFAWFLAAPGTIGPNRWGQDPREG